MLSLFQLQEIDEIFDAVEASGSGVGGNSFSMMLLNIGMFGVILTSIFIWLKLNQFENKNK